MLCGALRKLSGGRDGIEAESFVIICFEFKTTTWKQNSIKFLSSLYRFTVGALRKLPEGRDGDEAQAPIITRLNLETTAWTQNSIKSLSKASIA